VNGKLRTEENYIKTPFTTFFSSYC